MENIILSPDNPLRQNGLSLLRTRADKLDLKYIDQLILKSLQPHVMEFEQHEDAEGRFKNRQTYNEWAGKERIVYVLVTSKGDLAGVIWFGKRKNPQIEEKYTLTFGIRLYEGYLGKGLSKPLMKVSHDDIKNVLNDKYIWLDYDENNFIAGKAYGSFGYQELGRVDGRVIMGKKL